MPKRGAAARGGEDTDDEFEGGTRGRSTARRTTQQQTPRQTRSRPTNNQLL